MDKNIITPGAGETPPCPEVCSLFLFSWVFILSFWQIKASKEIRKERRTEIPKL